MKTGGLARLDMDPERHFATPISRAIALTICPAAHYMGAIAGTLAGARR